MTAAAEAERTRPRGRFMARLDIANLLWILPAALMFGVFYVGGFVQMLWRSVSEGGGGLGNYEEALSGEVYAIVFWNTAKVAVAVTAACLLIGYPLAYVMSRLRPNAQRVVLALVLIPFWISALVRNYSWIAILNRNGIVNSLLMLLGIIREPLPLIYNMTGVIVGMTYVLIPFMVLTLYGAMRGIEDVYLRASASLGASTSMTFRRVFLPLSLPGIWAGCLLVFTIAVGFFITPAMLGGGRVPMIATAIESQIHDVLNWGLGSALSVILLVWVLLIYAAFSRILGVKALLSRH
jgi:ABC-type spermidine/putrescine transport system permease subunit I